MKNAAKTLLFIYFISLFFNCYSETFRLASWNILAQTPYEKYAQKNIETMSWETRQQLIESTIKDLAQQGVDIICLQECDLRGFNEKKNNYNWLLTTLFKNGFTGALPKNNEKNQSQRDAMNKSYLVSLVFYRKEKFDADNSYTIPIGSYICGSTTLTLKNNTAPSIKVISLHRPSGKLTNLEDYLMKHSNKEGFTIVCGDFNYSTLKISYPDTQEKTQPYNDLITEERFTPKRWVDAFKENKNILPTAYSSSGYLERIDYIFYTPKDPKKSKSQINCISTEQIPHSELWKNLMKHNRGTIPENIPNFSDFPSDHAILISQFIIETEEEKETRLLKETTLKKTNTKIVDTLAQALFAVANNN